MPSSILILVTSILMFFMPTHGIAPYKQGEALPVAVNEYSGKGTTIYILDSGVDVNNPEFEGKAKNSDFQPLNQFIGEPKDKKCLHHGTAVASIAHKYAPQADIVSIRVSDCEGTSFDLIISQAIEHIINDGNTNRKIINLSLSFQDYQLGGVFTESSIEKATSSGIIVTIAAGNVEADGNPIRDACLRSPSRILNALTIGSYNPYTNDKSPYTAIGECVDVYAPGDGYIYDIEEGNEIFQIGTSYAAPYAAAMASRILEQHPQAETEDVNATISFKSNFKDFIKLEPTS